MKAKAKKKRPVGHPPGRDYTARVDIPLRPETKAALEAAAEAAGLSSVAALVRMWIVERLREVGGG